MVALEMICESQASALRIIANVYYSQAHALTIRARAEMRLAEEYDAAQDRGKVARSEQRTDPVSKGTEVKPTSADLGLARKDIFEARQLRDAERVEPGLIKRTLDGMVERGRSRDVEDCPALRAGAGV